MSILISIFNIVFLTILFFHAVSNELRLPDIGFIDGYDLSLFFDALWPVIVFGIFLILLTGVTVWMYWKQKRKLLGCLSLTFLLTGIWGILMAIGLQVLTLMKENSLKVALYRGIGTFQGMFLLTAFAFLIISFAMRSIIRVVEMTRRKNG